MRRRTVILIGAVLALAAAGAVTANAMTLRDEPGEAQSVEPVVGIPDPTLPSTSPSPDPSPSLAPVPPAPPEDIDDDDDDDDNDDADDNDDNDDNDDDG